MFQARMASHARANQAGGPECVASDHRSAGAPIKAIAPNTTATRTRKNRRGTASYENPGPITTTTVLTASVDHAALRPYCRGKHKSAEVAVTHHPKSCDASGEGLLRRFSQLAHRGWG